MDSPTTYNHATNGHAVSDEHSSKKLRSLFMQAPAAIALLEGPQHCYTLANPLYEKIFHRTEADLIGKTPKEVFPEVEGQGIHELFDQVYQTGQPFTAAEFPATFQDGGVVKTGYYNFVIQPIQNDAGEVTDLMVQVYEVTNQVEAHKKTEESEEKYRTLFNSIDDGFCTIDVLFDESGKPYDYRFLEVNTAFKHQTGLEDAEGRTMNDFARIEDFWYETYGNVAITGVPVRFESRAENLYRFYDVYAFKVGAAHERKVAVLFTDISERKRSEEALKASEDRYQNFIRQSTEGIWRFELKTPVPVQLPVEEQLALFHQHAYLAECNDAMAQMYGYRNAEELTGMRLSDFFPNDPDTTAYLTHFIQSGYRVQDAESKETDRQGNTLYFRNNLVGIVENGAVLRAWGTQRNITAQRAAEEKIKESEERFRTIADVTPNMVWAINLDGSTKYVNQYTLDYFGKTAGSFPSDWSALIHPDDIDFVSTTIQQAIARSTAYNMEFRLKRHDGAYRYFVASSAPAFMPDGSLYGYIGTTVDIHEIREAQLKLAESESRFRNLIEESTVAAAVLEGPEWELALANDRMLDIWQRDSSIVGKKLLDFMPELIGQPFPKLLKTVYDTGVTYSDEDALVVLNRGGKLENVYMDFSYKALRNSDGEVYAILVAAADVTERYRTKQQLRESEQRFQNLVREATVGIIVLSGAEMKVEIVNEAYAKLISRKAEELMGKELFTIIPETEEYFRPIIDGVRQSGKELYLYGTPYFVWVDGQKKEGYLNLVYQPYREADGTISGVMVLCQDVTEQILAAHKLKESEERLQAALNASLTGTFRWNIVTNDLSWDKNLDALFGQGQGGVQNFQSFINNIHPDDQAAVIKACEKCAAEGSDFDLEFRVIWPDGTTHWLDDKGKTYLDEAGRPAYLTGACVDITEHKESELLLKQSKQRFQGAVDAVEGILWTNNAQGEMEGEQPAWSALTGQSYDEYRGYGWSKAVHPDDAQPTVDAWNKAVRNKSIFVFEHRVKRADGTWGIYSIRAIPVLNKVGDILEWVGVHTDITQQRKAENNLRESEARFRLLSDEMPQFVWTGDAGGNLSYFNQAVYEYSGLTREDMENEGWIQIVHPEDREENIRLWQQSIATGEDFIFEHRFKRADGEYRWQLSRAVPQRDAQGMIQQWIGTSTDIHDKKNVEGQLEKLVEERTKELQRSNEDLQQFAHVASHDLKEPVRKVLNFSSRLKSEYETVLAGKGTTYLSKIESSAIRMYSMIDGVLLYSSLNALEQTKELVDLAEMVQNIEADLEVIIAEKEATITYGDLPQIEGSSILLYQLFYNLLNNALKFSRSEISPVIEINASAAEEKDLERHELAKEKAYINIQIRDNGIGFANSNAEKIFGTFTRLHAKDKYEGTGLGLSLCKKIVERHGGVIYAGGEEDKGATFTILLPR